MIGREEQLPVLVLGGTGKTGSRVVKGLIEQGRKVRIGSRAAAIPFDWEDVDGWAKAVRGTSAIYISYFPDLCVPGAVEAVRALAELALSLGTRRLVLLSGRGEDEARRAEDTLKASGADWTIIRASWFAQNFSESFLLDQVLSGTVALPAGGVKEPFVDVEDIAEIAVAALTDPVHIGHLYEVTGPDLLSFDEAVAIVAREAGRPMRFVEMSVEDYAAAMRQAELPEEMLQLLLYLFDKVLDGRNAAVTDGVRQALGRQPRSFSAYAARTARSGIWTSTLERAAL